MLSENGNWWNHWHVKTTNVYNMYMYIAPAKHSKFQWRVGHGCLLSPDLFFNSLSEIILQVVENEGGTWNWWSQSQPPLMRGWHSSKSKFWESYMQILLRKMKIWFWSCIHVKKMECIVVNRKPNAPKCAIK